MKTIKEVIDLKVRPVLNAHGGDVELLEITADGYAKVKLIGACAGCPGAQQTLVDVVEAALKAEVPGVKGVIAEQHVDENLIQQALAIIRKRQG